MGYIDYRRTAQKPLTPVPDCFADLLLRHAIMPKCQSKEDSKSQNQGIEVADLNLSIVYGLCGPASPMRSNSNSTPAIVIRSLDLRFSSATIIFYMKRLSLAALLLAVLTPLACAQSVSNDQERHQRIIANLKFEYPQLANAQIVVNEIEATDTPGLQHGTITLDGAQEQPFIITADDSKLYLVISEAIDIRRSADDLASVESERLTEAENELFAAFNHLPVRGNPNAPITIIEFSDFQCPYCQRAAVTVEALLENNPDTIRFYYVQYPLPNHPWGRQASIASLCAVQQNADETFWTLHDNYFENQRTLSMSNVNDLSREWVADTDIDFDAWNTCFSDTSSDAHRAAIAELEAGMQIASQYGVSGTPAFFINGRFLGGAQPLEVFQALIDDITGN